MTQAATPAGSPIAWCARFGSERVFMDVSDIQPGQNFEQAIERTLARCDHLLAVIGPQWLTSLTARQATGEDFVRSEIAAALSRGTTVIPGTGWRSRDAHRSAAACGPGSLR